MKVVGGILAGGIGSRMKSELPKQFLKVGNIPIIVRVIKKFKEKEMDKIIVAMNSDWIEYCEKLLSDWEIDTEDVVLISGGKTRFDSLINISQAANNLWEDVVVVSHDCARVFVSGSIIEKNIKAVKRGSCVTTSVPTIDTVLVSKDGINSDNVPERSEIFLDQGPQTFYADEFLSLANSLNEIKKSEYMEAGKLYIDHGYPVAIVEGERTNFKMTTDFDIKFGEYLISEGYIE